MHVPNRLYSASTARTALCILAKLRILDTLHHQNLEKCEKLPKYLYKSVIYPYINYYLYIERQNNT